MVVWVRPMFNIYFYNYYCWYIVSLTDIIFRIYFCSFFVWVKPTIITSIMSLSLFFLANILFFFVVSLRNRLLIFKSSPTNGVGRTNPTLPTSHAPPRLSQLLGEPCSTINPWSFRIHQQKPQERRHKSITWYQSYGLQEINVSFHFLCLSSSYFRVVHHLFMLSYCFYIFNLI